jgi:hypothetical protein
MFQAIFNLFQIIRLFISICKLEEYINMRKINFSK